MNPQGKWYPGILATWINVSPKGISVSQSNPPWSPEHPMKSGGYPPFPPLLRTIRVGWAKKEPLTPPSSSLFLSLPNDPFWILSLLLTSQQYWNVRFLFHTAPPSSTLFPFLSLLKGPFLARDHLLDNFFFFKPGTWKTSCTTLTFKKVGYPLGTKSGLPTTCSQSRHYSPKVCKVPTTWGH